MENIKGVVLAGGRGTRLATITDNMYHKSFIALDDKGNRGIDLIHSLLMSVGVSEIIYSVETFADDFKKFIEDKPNSHVSKQQKYLGTAGAVTEIIEEQGLASQYLVISSDMYFHATDIAKLITGHRKGQITWGVSPLIHAMESYYGIIVDNNSDAIIGDRKFPSCTDWDLPGYSQYVKGGINLIDPQVYLHNLEIMRRLGHANPAVDLYWEFLPLMEERNRRRMLRKQPSILQAVIFDYPIIDYGTPDRLESLRKGLT